VARKKHAHHGGAWKVAYADFVTAMMAFFLVLWIVGLSSSTKKAVESYFKTQLTSVADLLYFNGFAPKQEAIPFQLPWQTLSGPKFIPIPRPRRDIKNIEALRAELRKVTSASASLRLTIDENEIRIDLVDSEEAGLFGTMMERFTPLLRQMIREIAPLLREMPNRIVIEGHTNSIPYQGPSGESNWELSIERANMVRLLLEQQGLPDRQIIEIKGCSDLYPLDRIHPMSLANRRVAIIIKRRLPFIPELDAPFGQ